LASIRVPMGDVPILYSFRRCPYAMRARMAVFASGVTVELREIILRDKPPEMLAASPKGTVPVLILPDGRVIDESLDIMRWALAQNDPDNWLAGDDPALIAENDGPFKAALDRYKYPEKHGVPDTAEPRAVGMEFLTTLNARLDDRKFLAGNDSGLTDFAIFPFVRQFAATDSLWFDAQPLPGLQRWLSTNLASSLFNAIMGRYARWNAGDVPIYFGPSAKAVAAPAHAA
jgi:glutathione S-transferase